MPEPIPTYILDSFALLAYLQAEPEGLLIRNLLEQARAQQALLGMSLINLGETYYLMRLRSVQFTNANATYVSTKVLLKSCRITARSICCSVG